MSEVLLGLIVVGAFGTGVGVGLAIGAFGVKAFRHWLRRHEED